jgi:hypothetical protein
MDTLETYQASPLADAGRPADRRATPRDPIAFVFPVKDLNAF